MEAPFSMDGRRTRVLLAAEQSLFRQAVRTALENQTDFEVVAEARDGLEVVTKSERLQPDVVLLDARLPGRDGIQATALIKESAPGCKVVLLGEEEDERLVADAVIAGADGYLTKSYPLRALIAGTRALVQGEVLIPRRMIGSLLAVLLGRRQEQDEALRRLSMLTNRQREVLALLADGADNAAIAGALVISPQTARTHVQHILKKLGLHSRLEAAAFAVRNGLYEASEQRQATSAGMSAQASTGVNG